MIANPIKIFYPLSKGRVVSLIAEQMSIIYVYLRVMSYSSPSIPANISEVCDYSSIEYRDMFKAPSYSFYIEEKYILNEDIPFFLLLIEGF